MSVHLLLYREVDDWTFTSGQKNNQPNGRQVTRDPRRLSPTAAASANTNTKEN